MSLSRTVVQQLLPGLRQVLAQQAAGANGCSTSLACQAAEGVFMKAMHSTTGSQFRHLATAVGARKVSLITNLKQLSKFKLSSLVVLTASAGFMMGSGEVLDWQGLVWTSLGTFGAAACANTLNQVYEVANDRMMNRTCNRPLPSGRMNRGQAIAFAIAAGVLGLGILYTQTNELTTALGAANIFLYAGVYTPLKQVSIANTWVGAVVGAIPPLMGWASASGQLDMGAYVLAGALFFWQLPHFLALAWLCKDDYLRGGFKMISGLDRSGKRTAAAALRNSIYLLPFGLLAYYANVATEPLAWEVAALGGMMLLPAVKFYKQPSQQTARKLFRSSLLYLPLLMAGMMVHRQPHMQSQSMTLGEMQQAVLEHVQGPPHAGVLPLMRASLEESTAAVGRVLGLSQALIRCPSTVHSDDGSTHNAPASMSGVEQIQHAGEGFASEEGTVQALVGAGLPPVPEVVVLRHVTSMAEHHAVVADQRQRRQVWVAGGAHSSQQSDATWRGGLDLWH